MRKQTRTAFAKELDRYQPGLGRAFLEAIQDIRSSSQRIVVQAAIERGDIQAVINAIALGEEFFAPLDRARTDVFVQGALWQLEQLPKKAGPEGPQLNIRFDHRNPRAEQMARQKAGQLIQEITEDQRFLVRETVLEGIEDGRGAASIARDLIGTRRGNQRVGALIGLHSREAEAVRRARRELADPETMRSFLQRKSANGNDLRTVRKAIREGRRLSQKQIYQITQRYADRLLSVRAKRIARTETHNAFSAGRDEANRQMIESGQVPADAVTLVWQATPGSRTRDTHRSMNGQTVRFGEAFTSPRGAQLMFPGDSSLGAPASELVNCRCGVRYEIDFVRLAT